MPLPRHRRRRKGFVLITTAICALMLMAGIGLAFDLGRMFVVKSEAQSFVDAAALNGAIYLDGTADGLAEADASARGTKGSYHFNSTNFATRIVEFSPSSAGPWSSVAAAPLNSRFVRVITNVPVTLHFLNMLNAGRTTNVSALGIAGQVEKTVFSEGLFPFSPFAKDTVGPRFGLIPGELYTLRWPSNVDIDKKNKKNLCKGDWDNGTIDKAQAMGGDERGYIEQSSAQVIRDTIENDYMSVELEIGDPVTFTGGAKQSQLTSLHDRIAQDTDTVSQTYADYLRRNTGNGRRIVAVPINDGGTPIGVNQTVVGFGAFFLRRTGEYGNGGNQSWCAEYIGAWLQGGRRKAVMPGGTYVVRLVE